jgi:predicted nucleotidyltransferase
MLSVDLFAENPIPFADLLARSQSVAIEGEAVVICSIEDLIALKKRAGRPQDIIDIENLQRIQEKRDNG